MEPNREKTSFGKTVLNLFVVIRNGNPGVEALGHYQSDNPNVDPSGDYQSDNPNVETLGDYQSDNPNVETWNP